MIPGLARFLARLQAVFTKRALDDEFNAELAHHLALQTEDNLKAGMPPEEAHRQACIALGGLAQTRELNRETRGVPWLEQLGSDVRYSCRVFRRERGFTTVALLILAIGVGLNTTVSNLVGTLLLRPLPFAESERLVWIANGPPNQPTRDWSALASRIDTWDGLRETTQTFDRIEAYYPFSALRTGRLAAANEPVSVIGFGVSAGLFDLLGLQPLHGRFFLAEDGQDNASRRVVLSHHLWQRRFAADPRIVGQMIRIDGQPAEVIGVMPASDRFVEVFSPAVRLDYYWAIQHALLHSSGNTLALVGRMKPGITAVQAQADLNLTIDQLKQRHPDRDKYYWANLTPLQDRVVGELRRPLIFLWMAAGLVLAIAAFNLGGLLLARGAARRKEFALRLALGASRGRIVRQLLTECLLLTIVGSVLGALLAFAFLRYLAVRSAVEIPLLHSLQFDGATLGFTALLCVGTAVFCWLFPAWQVSGSANFQSPLNDEGHGSTIGRRQSRLRSGLVVIEVALACVLVASAGLMMRSFIKLLKVDLGFSPEHVLAARIDTVVPWEQIPVYLETILDRVRAQPGVEQAGLTDCIPVERDRSWGAYPINTDNPKDQRWTGAHIRIVSPGLFAAMGTRVIAGRDFARTDGLQQQPVIVINRTMAELFWPGQDPIGRFVMVYDSRLTPRRVIGLVEDVHHSSPAAAPGNEMYLSLRQSPSNSFDLLVRTRLPVGALTANLRHALHEVDPTLPFTMVRPLETLVARSVSSQRLLVSLVGGFAALALGLAALGLYGLISYTVTQRTREIGIRMALGASAATVQRDVIGRTLKLAAWGLGLGLTAAFAAGHLMRALLFGISPIDPVTFGVMPVALLACAFIAGYLPALRASRIDPMQALRAE